MATNWMFLNSDDTAPVHDEINPENPASGPVVSGPGPVLPPSPIPGTKGIRSHKELWDAFCATSGSKICRVTATGITKGDFMVSPSVMVTEMVDIESELQQLAIDRINDIKAAAGSEWPTELENALVAKVAYLASAQKASDKAALEVVLVESRKMPQIQIKNGVLDACRADVGGAKWATNWMTAYMEQIKKTDQSSVKANFQTAVETALGI